MTGETPIVDVQSVTRQRVINQEIIEAIPTGTQSVQPRRADSRRDDQRLESTGRRRSAGLDAAFAIVVHGSTAGLAADHPERHHARHDSRRRLRRRRRAERVGGPGVDVRLLGRLGGAGHRRRADQFHSEGRRQRLQGRRVRQLLEQLAAGQQFLAGPEGSRPARTRTR